MHCCCLLRIFFFSVKCNFWQFSYSYRMHCQLLQLHVLFYNCSYYCHYYLVLINNIVTIHHHHFFFNTISYLFPIWKKRKCNYKNALLQLLMVWLRVFIYNVGLKKYFVFLGLCEFQSWVKISVLVIWNYM